MEGNAAIHHVCEQKHEISHVKDVEIIASATEALEHGKEVSLEYAIANTDRSVGAMLSGAVATRYGNEGLPEQTINVKFKGSAGQSFGAFLAHGICFKLEGEANDYLGKGLSGGLISVRPPVRSNFDAEKNTIAGNTLLYGATSGEVYINGRAGERFAVRNSGAIAVVEGVGDHCCEYMTGGRVVVLGETGRNFAAGMSGGVAYVWDKDHTFDYFCNMEMVELSLLENSTSRKELHELVRQHYLYTGSTLARHSHRIQTRTGRRTDAQAATKNSRRTTGLLTDSTNDKNKEKWETLKHSLPYRGRKPATARYMTASTTSAKWNRP